MLSPSKTGLEKNIDSNPLNLGGRTIWSLGKQWLSIIESCSEVVCERLCNEHVWGQGALMRTLDCLCELGGLSKLCLCL